MPRDPRDERLINGMWASGSQLESGDAGDQPGAIPHFNGAPTVSDLPVEQETGNPVSLLYFDTSTGIYNIATPDGNGGIVTTNLLDVSASVNLGGIDSGGLL